MMNKPTAAESPVSETPVPVSPVSETHEVLPVAPKRRVFSPAEKLRIVKAASACRDRGEVGALLRREGIYSSHLAAWRKAFESQGVQGLAPRRPGRKSRVEPKDAQIAALSRRAERLEAELELSRKLLELQKKLSELLGVTLPRFEEA